jgi:hypothetical protein
MSNLYRGPSIDASYHISIHLGKHFSGEDFLEINQSETRMACGGHVCKRIGTFLSPLPLTKRKCCTMILKRMQLTSLE